MRKVFVFIRSYIRIEEIGFFAFLLLIVLSFFNSTQGNSHILNLEKLLLFFTFFSTVVIISISYRPFRVIRNWLPILFFLSIYLNLQHLIDILNPNHYDEILIRVDQVLFGVQPSLWMEGLISSPLTDFLTICYSFFYFYPLPLAVILYLRKGGLGDFRNYATSIILCFYLGFVGYLLVPAFGPRFSLHYTQELKGSSFSESIRSKLDHMESTKKDVFPSLHNAVVLLVLLFAYKHQRIMFYLFLPIGLGIFLSTIYLRYHYGIDVIYGWILGLICLRLGADVNRWWKIS